MAYRPQVLTVPNGGTGDITLTNHGVLIGRATSAIASTVAGTAGQVLQSGGASADPTYSTATFPSTATGTGTILRADGTNWVATTATYPNTAGTSGNVLTSDGTNWNSSTPAAGSGLVTITGTLTNSQIKALHATPITAIAAQGSGSVIQVVSYAIKMNYGGTNVFTAGAAQTIDLWYATATVIDQGLTNGMVVASSTQIDGGTGNDIGTPSTFSTYDNVAVTWYNPVATEISGNAANNNTCTYSITYKVLTI